MWAPPKIWTAWPLKERQLPGEGLLKRQRDEDDRFTFRTEGQAMPSSELQEELSATVLRFAKDRFQRRQKKSLQKSVETDQAQGDDSDEEAPQSDSLELKSEAETSPMDVDEQAATKRASSPEPPYAAVSADDDLSYNLLRAPVRHILSQLDTTLTILHNARVAGLMYLSDSSTEDDSDTQNPGKKARGRPRSTSRPAAPTAAAAERPRISRRGRPKKVHLPRDGESHQDMLDRIAREGHRRLPPRAEDKDAAFEEWLRQSEERAKREQEEPKQQQEAEGSRSRRPSQEVDTGDEELGAASNVQKKLARWGLRDWSDVVGAAALAGFPGDVIARTTRRCADLFGEGMVIRRLDEVPSSRGPGVHTAEYQPKKMQLPDSSPSSDDNSPSPTLAQRRLASLARSNQSSPSPARSRGRSRGRSASSLQGGGSARSLTGSRSRFRSSAGLFFCPVESCRRAVEGFDRRPNLRRHVELVHPGRQEDAVDSDEEAVGAVRVDGFLRPIAPGRGWRAEDVETRMRKRFYGRREVVSSARSEAVDTDGDDELSD